MKSILLLPPKPPCSGDPKCCFQDDTHFERQMAKGNVCFILQGAFWILLTMAGYCSTFNCCHDYRRGARRDSQRATSLYHLQGFTVLFSASELCNFRRFCSIFFSIRRPRCTKYLSGGEGLPVYPPLIRFDLTVINVRWKSLPPLKKKDSHGNKRYEYQ